MPRTTRSAVTSKPTMTSLPLSGASNTYLSAPASPINVSLPPPSIRPSFPSPPRTLSAPHAFGAGTSYRLPHPWPAEHPIITGLPIPWARLSVPVDRFVAATAVHQVVAGIAGYDIVTTIAVHRVFAVAAVQVVGADSA